LPAKEREEEKPKTPYEIMRQILEGKKASKEKKRSNR